MEHLEELKAWLMTFPQWEDADLAVDMLGAKPGACGLFPQGVRVLEHYENILGDTFTRYEQTFLVRRVGPRSLKGAAWIMEFCGWVHDHVRSAPRFGKYQRLHTQSGKMVNASQPSMGIYEIKLIFEYVIEE